MRKQSLRLRDFTKKINVKMKKTGKKKNVLNIKDHFVENSAFSMGPLRNVSVTNEYVWFVHWIS